MRALTPDNRLNALHCAWDGAANNSTSRLEVNGTMVRKNLFSKPIAKDIDAWHTPGSGWGGTPPSKSLGDGFIRFTHPYGGTTIVNGDLSYSIRGNFATEAGKQLISQILIRSSAPLSVRLQNQFVVGYSNGLSFNLLPGEWTWIWCQTVNSYKADSMRLDIDSVAPVSFPAGTTLDVAFAFVEETTKRLPPFSGDTKGEELLSLSLSTNPSWYGLAA